MERCCIPQNPPFQFHFIRVALLRKLPGYRCTHARRKANSQCIPRVGLSQTATHGQMFDLSIYHGHYTHKTDWVHNKNRASAIEIVCRHCKHSRRATMRSWMGLSLGDRRRNNGTLPIPKAHPVGNVESHFLRTVGVRPDGHRLAPSSRNRLKYSDVGDGAPQRMAQAGDIELQSLAILEPAPGGSHRSLVVVVVHIHRNAFECR